MSVLFHSFELTFPERQQAQDRRKQKKATKKAQAEAKAQKEEQKVQILKERAQTLRSDIFQAARERNSAKVKDGISDFSVDASGGEVRTGCEKFVKVLPNDLQETLLHIAAKNGDADLVAYLDRHGKRFWFYPSLDLTGADQVQSLTTGIRTVSHPFT